MNAFRRFLYRLASLLGDVNAVQSGPSATAKRFLRKRVTRAVSGAVGRLFR